MTMVNQFSKSRPPISWSVKTRMFIFGKHERVCNWKHLAEPITRDSKM